MKHTWPNHLKTPGGCPKDLDHLSVTTGDISIPVIVERLFPLYPLPFVLAQGNRNRTEMVRNSIPNRTVLLEAVILTWWLGVKSLWPLFRKTIRCLFVFSADSKVTGPGCAGVWYQKQESMKS